MRGALGVTLAARSHREGRALRSALFRHRHLVDKPIVLAFWQLGAEPFAASAIAWGESQKRLEMTVAGDPRNRDLAFAALLDLARWFVPRYEAFGDKRETLVSKRGDRERNRVVAAPQIVVANTATIELIGRLGRRLAYLPTEGEWAADPLLPQLGRHFQFLARHARTPGQQLIVAMDAFLRDHWVTPQSALERASLGALDAYIEPPDGVHGFVAAAAAEKRSVGPVPGDEDDDLQPLIESLNQGRGTVTERKKLGKLLAPIEDHYRPLLHGTWELIWRAWHRERDVGEASSVSRRWDVDRDEYTRHMDFIAAGFRRRARQSAKQAAEHLRRLEEAQSQLDTEQACDDPVRMIPYLLEHKAVAGKVAKIEPDHKEQGPKRMVTRPLVTLAIDGASLMPPGKELWRVDVPSGPGFEVVSVARTKVVLKGLSPNVITGLEVGQSMCFSVLHKSSYFPPPLPRTPPWSHAPRDEVMPGDLEERPS